ncbi:MAG: class I SAM-dependent rRNA methyltransferase [Anaerolineae bacterium]
MIDLDLPAGLKPALDRGHPWVYRDQVARDPGLPSGTWVRVRCDGFSAYGLWDARSPIGVRLFSRRQVPDAGWVASRVAEAWAGRSSLRETPTTAYRWVYGEGDGLPGLVVDLYAEYAVVRSYAESVEVLVPWLADALHAHARLRGILWRRSGGEGRDDGRSSGLGEVLWGRPPPRDLVVEEHGLLLAADLAAGQKTGLYFDQRENRRTLAPWCENKTVLDTFCYTGAFSLYALRAGAAQVTECDAAPAAVEAARHNLELNGFQPAAHTFLVQDCFQLLDQYAAAGRRFDVVILDPPSLARDRSSRRAAERAYVRLNRRAIDCVEPGGLLASASCTAQVAPAAFRQALAEAARRAGRRLLILHDAGQPLDHPVAAHFPEGRYLKFVLARVLPLV